MCAQSCLTLCVHGLQPPGSSVQQIFQTSILGWVAIPSSGILPTHRLNPSLLHFLNCQADSLCSPHIGRQTQPLKNQGSPRTIAFKNYSSLGTYLPVRSESTDTKFETQYLFFLSSQDQSHAKPDLRSRKQTSTPI